jgi:acyl carrier protein
MTTTFDRIRDIIVRDFELSAERLRRETPLEEIELDSLAVTELVFALEDEFHVTAGNAIPSFKNLGDIADYVGQLIVERDAAPKAPRIDAGKRPAAAPANGGPTRTQSATRAARAKAPRPVARSVPVGAPKPATSSGKSRRGATNGGRRANGAAAQAADAAKPSARPARKRKRASAPPDGARPR